MLIGVSPDMPRRFSRRTAKQHGALVALLAASALAYTPAARAEYEPPPPPPPAPTEEIYISYSAGAAAFSNGVYNSSIRDNVVVDGYSTRATLLENSVMGNIGVVQINQDAGIGANQANMVSIAVAAGANPVYGATFNGEAIFTGNDITVGNVTRTNTINNILSGSAGIVQINQNTGSLNVNLNYLGLALALGTGQYSVGVAVTDTGLARVATNNTITLDGPVNQTNVISGVYNFTGIGQINQTVGDGNVAANVMTINVTVMNLQ